MPIHLRAPKQNCSQDPPVIWKLLLCTFFQEMVLVHQKKSTMLEAHQMCLNQFASLFVTFWKISIMVQTQYIRSGLKMILQHNSLSKAQVSLKA